MSNGRLDEGALLNNRYSILEVVGRGGMGTVYRAQDTRLEVIVAVKEMIEKDVPPDERTMAVRQFEREAKLLGQLSHVNLPRVTDYFVEDDHCYLIMEFVVGATLESLLRQPKDSALPLLDVLAWAIELSDVLTYLHSQDPPIVFRDIKPANIMLQSDNVVKLIDFGIARRFNSDATKDTLLYGSPGYSPPEQYGRAQTDPRSDIYALGATLHHLVTGRDPSSTPFRFPPARQINGKVPPPLDALIAKCVEMDEDKRMQSALELRDSLVLIRSSLVNAIDILNEPLSFSSAPIAIETSPSVPIKITGPKVPTVRSSNTLGANNNSKYAVIAAILVVIFITGFGISKSKSSSSKTRTANVSGPAKQNSEVPVSQSPTNVDLDKSATLKIRTNPAGAKVFVDGKSYGVSPVEVSKLTSGKHTVRMVPVANSGLTEITRQIDLEPGAVKDIETNFQSESASNPETPSVAGVPVANISSMDAAETQLKNPDRPGITVNIAYRVSGAIGKSGIVAVFFYGSDGSTPLKPKSEVEKFGNSEGNLSVSHALNVASDPADFVIGLAIPYAVFPVDSPTKVTYRAVVFVDNKVIGQTDIKPLAR